MSGTARALGVVLTLAAALVVGPSTARAERLSLRNRAWNGLSELFDLSRDATPRVALAERLDVARLGSHDALLIVHPQTALPVSELAMFLRRGGRLAIADDFGTAQSLLHAFGIGRHTVAPSTKAHPLRGNAHLLLAEPRGRHPLSQGIVALATNHAQVLYHPQLAPLFAFDDGSASAMVLSGAVGSGRLVAISDSSVLINHMLVLEDNRLFARNLVRYLMEGREGTLHLVDGDTTFAGAFGARGANDPMRGISDALARVATLALPKVAVVAMTAVLALMLLAAAASVLPRNASYTRRWVRTPACVAGYAGLVHHHSQRRGNFLAPALQLGIELDHRLATLVGIRHPPQRPELLQQLRTRMPGEAEMTDVRALLATLDRLHARAQRETVRVSQRQFVELVARGRRILARLETTARDRT